MRCKTCIFFVSRLFECYLFPGFFIHSTLVACGGLLCSRGGRAAPCSGSAHGAWTLRPRSSVAAARGSVVVAPRPQSTGPPVLALRLRCSAACVIFLDQGSNPRLLPWQADSLLLSQGGSASCYLLIVGGNIGFPFVVVTSNESIVKK